MVGRRSLMRDTTEDGHPKDGMKDTGVQLDRSQGWDTASCLPDLEDTKGDTEEVVRRSQNGDITKDDPVF